MNEITKPLDVALAFTKAWTGHDLTKARGYLADDIVFDGPLQQSTGIGPYVEGLGRLSQAVTGIEIIAAFGDEEKALVMYDLLTEPFGRLTCAKCFTVRDGKIQKDQLTFDSDKIRNPTKR